MSAVGAVGEGGDQFGALTALRTHWPEYALEAAELGTFMLLAGVATVAFAAAGSPLRIHDAVLQRAVIGLAMGLIAIGIIYSPAGRRSGAHFNPSVTLSFLRLRMVKTWDAVFYIGAQIVGGVAGVLAARAIVGAAFSRTPVHYIVTVPGHRGAGIAFAAEAGIAFVLMSTVLALASRPRLAHYTGLGAGALVASFVLVESPISGMSMNPARSFGSALPAGEWSGFWIYLLAPTLAMLAAAELHLRFGPGTLHSAKLHDDHRHCVFHCNQHQGQPTR